MKNRHKRFLSSWSNMDFGDVHFFGAQKDFYTDLNRKVLALCDTLPESVQTDALLFFMKYSGLSIGQNLDFFKNYIVPSWSILYWVTCDALGHQISSEEVNHAITAHAMAMMLHSLDDHINDGQLPATHLTLLLRSQAWMAMHYSLNELSKDSVDCEKTVVGFIDIYYSSIIGPNKISSLDQYCQLFRQQMASWVITPTLILKKTKYNKAFIHSVQRAYESFGIAWRLLDDINDIEMDICNGENSSIYADLPLKMKKIWPKGKKETEIENTENVDIIIDHIMNTNLIDRIRDRILKELESAAAIFMDCQLGTLAAECHCLLEPLRGNRQFSDIKR